MPDTKLHFTRSDGDHAGSCVLRLTGPLVMATANDFQNYLRKETAQPVILDFSEVPYTDSSGLGAMLSICVHYKQANRQVALTGLNDNCSTLLRMTHVEKFFTFVP
jgi:anti-anti-sigma factor